jgi:hypothetical protein
VADKSPHKIAAKKPGKSLKEKRAAKKAKHTTQVQPLLPPRHG